MLWHGGEVLAATEAGSFRLRVTDPRAGVPISNKKKGVVAPGCGFPHHSTPVCVLPPYIVTSVGDIHGSQSEVVLWHVDLYPSVCRHRNGRAAHDQGSA